MKLLELDLHAYGPFSGIRLDLSKGNEGLHVIYGPNEAGKSSALRALHALLYGIPERTTDDFIHDKQTLRVGGRFCGAAGKELIVYRRKGRKNTLLADVDGEPLDDGVMKVLLAGVDEPLFKSLFGINHLAMVEGGNTLLLERGREAEALFGSGLGSTAVHTLLESFEDQARGLFAPQASKPQINRRLKELKGVQAQLREFSLSARKWDEARKAVDRAKTTLADVERRIAEDSKAQSFLERVRRTLPNLAKRQEHLSRLAELSEIPQLTTDFSKSCEEAMDSRLRAMEDHRKAKTLIGDLKKKIAKIDYSKDLIEKAGEIDAVRERLGSYRKANADLPKLIARHADRKTAATESLSSIRPDLVADDVASLRAARGKRRRLTELGGQQDILLNAVGSAEKALDKAKADLEKNEHDRAKVDDRAEPARLRAAVNRGRALGEIDEDISVEKSRVENDYRNAQTQLEALGLWNGSLRDLQSAPLPSLESIQTHIDEEKEIKEARDSASKDRQSAADETRRAKEAIRKLELSGDVPAEADLQDIRARRDEVWQLLRAKWLDGADIVSKSKDFGGVEELPETLESSIEASDETADRLRREAHRVHDDAAARARQESCQAIIEETDLTLAEIAGRENKYLDEWAHLWKGTNISPCSPTEMAAWMSGAIRIRERVYEINDRNAQLENRIARRTDAVRDLVENIVAVGAEADNLQDDDLRPVLARAEDCLANIEGSRQKIEQLSEKALELERQIARSKDDLTGAKESLKTWQTQWHNKLSLLGLDEDSTAGDVLDYLDACDSIINLVDESSQLEQRISAINKDNDKFDADLHELLGVVGTDLSGLAASEAISKLAARLTDNRTAATRHQSLSEQLDKAKQELSEAEATIAASSEKLDTLCQLAGCEKAEDLAAVGRKAAERDRLTVIIKSIEVELLDGGDGLSIEQLQKEAADIDRDQVAAQIQQINDRINNELRPEQRRLIEQKAEAEHAFSEMTGEDDAARLADEAQQIISEIRTLAAEYVRSRIAGRVLRDQIEKYRSEHRSPILAKASHYFSRLTCNAYGEITTTLDASDLPVLVGVRSDDERKRVEQMSDGTRDQLYLALRLATIEHYSESSEPLPFIVDDVLIQFDDDRSSATLDTLADFSARTQVILFTHHRQVAEQAKVIPTQKNGVFLHQL